MEKSTIIELSRWTASDTISNSQWCNNLSIPQIINENDIIAIRDVFLDTQQISSDAIEIKADTVLNLNFVYFMNNTGIGMYYCVPDGDHNPIFHTTFTPPGVDTPAYEIAPDGLPYVLVNQDPNAPPALYGKPVIETLKLNIEKGVYQRAYFDKYLTRQLERVGQPQNQFMNSPSQFFTRGTVSPESDSTGFFQFSKPTNPPPESRIITTVQKQLYYGVWDGLGTAPTLKSTLFYLNSQNQYIACKFCRMTDNSYYANFLTPFGNDAILAPITVPNAGKEFANINYNGNDFRLWDAGMIGCSEISIVYSDEGNGKYEFQYLHTPIIQNGNESAGIYVNQELGENVSATVYSLSFINCNSGIMFVNAYTDDGYNPLKIEEVALLNQMGIKLNDIIPMDDLYNVFAPSNNFLSGSYSKFQYPNFLKYTTRQFIPLDALVESSSKAAIPGVAPGINYNMDISKSIIANIPGEYSSYYFNGSGFNIVQSNITEPIVASTNPVSSLTATAHFLLDISGYPANYVNNEKVYNIHGILGSYYYNQSFTMMAGGFDSLIYQHIGEPIVLGKLDIKICDPYSKKPYSDEIIGTNSSIYLQITKQLQQTPQQKK